MATRNFKPHTRYFDAERDRLYGIAYRMLGSLSQAEDILQETFIKWQRVNLAQVKAPAAYLTTIVTRLCIDAKRSARANRLIYTGPWLPEPVSDEVMEPLCPSAFSNPERSLEQAESVSIAFLALLETLAPLERAVFILKEAFDTEHTEIATTLNITPAHSRQLLRRARGKITKKRHPVTRPDEAQHLIEQFMLAAATGNLDELHQLMSDDIVAYSDGGGRASAALIPLHGKDKVSTVFLHLVNHQKLELVPEFKAANGGICLILWDGTEIHSSHTITAKEGRIHRIYTTRNPDKLKHL